jgi:hypothetical protein
MKKQDYIVAESHWIETLQDHNHHLVAAFESKKDAENFIEASNKGNTNGNISFGFFDTFKQPIPFSPASKAATVSAQQFNELYMGTFKTPPTFTHQFVGGTSNLPVIKVTLQHFVDQIDDTPLQWEGTGSSKADAKQQAINLAMKYFSTIFR